MKRLLVFGLALVLLIGGCGADEDSSVEVTYETEVVPVEQADHGHDHEMEMAMDGSLEGTSVAEFPDDGIVDQDGQPVSVDDLPETPLVLSFIYTRCPMDSMCPRITRNMVELEERANREDTPTVQFVLVTFDPEYDRPEVLREYGERFDVDYKGFSFWTGEPEAVHDFNKRFGIFTVVEDDFVEAHNMRTYVIDQDRIVQDVFRGSDWSVQEVQSSLAELLSG